MPKDNREVLRGFTVVEDNKQRTITDIDEIAGRFTQPELDDFVGRGLLEGDWVSMKKEDEGDGETPDGILSLDETMKRFQGFDFSDEVINSLRHHKPELTERFGGQSAEPSSAPKKEIGGGQVKTNESENKTQPGVQTLFTKADVENDPKAELMNKVDQLRKGGYVVEVSDTATKAVIIDAILTAKKAE